MKKIILIVLFISLASCQQTHTKQQTNSYKPGFGALMGTIQNHHAKLWFAGINNNWKLAEFELHEIAETLEDIEKYQKDRKESALLHMIEPALDNTKIAVVKKDSSSFVTQYKQLTQSCNTCHIDTNYEYIRIKNPTVSPFSNQEFKSK